MRSELFRKMFACTAPRAELVLRLEDGTPGRLSVSAGCERFIGAYPRLPGISSDGPLLTFRTVEPAA